MVLHVLYIPVYPHVPYGIACTMCRGGIVFHDFGAAHDVCLDPLVRSPGVPDDWLRSFNTFHTRKVTNKLLIFSIIFVHYIAY